MPCTVSLTGEIQRFSVPQLGYLGYSKLLAEEKRDSRRPEHAGRAGFSGRSSAVV